MSKNKNIIIVIFLFIATILMGIGYAAVNSVTLDIGGEITAQLQSGIFITDARYLSNNNAILEDSYIINFRQNMFASNIALSANDSNSSITYEITIYNSTTEDYFFQKVDYMDDESTYSNPGITYELNGIDQNTILGSNQSMSFTITFKYKDGIIADNNLVSYLNFTFNKKYFITYENLNNTYQNVVYEGESLILDLSNETIYGVNIYVGDTVFQDYTYENKTLTINNVTSDLTIKGMVNLGYDIIVTDDKNTFITVDQNTTGDITMNEYQERQLNGMNVTNGVITKIDVIITYSTTSGSNQSIESRLILEDGTTLAQKIEFTGKQEHITRTITFNNLSIPIGGKFNINNYISKITNQKIEIHSEEIIFYNN